MTHPHFRPTSKTQLRWLFTLVFLLLPLTGYSYDKVMPNGTMIYNYVEPGSEGDPNDSNDLNPTGKSELDQRLAEANKLRLEQDAREKAADEAAAQNRKRRDEELARKANDDAVAAAAARVAASKMNPEETHNPASTLLMVLLASIATCGIIWWYRRD